MQVIYLVIVIFLSIVSAIILVLVILNIVKQSRIRKQKKRRHEARITAEGESESSNIINSSEVNQKFKILPGPIVVAIDSDEEIEI
jgi:NADH:ubiquinone oxidoreductase subunit 3 (subunit A)